LAVKIARQSKKIALIGAPSSAAAFLPGSEKAPAALRAAGLIERLQSAGFEVIDHGDCAPRLFADDDEHRRARNVSEIVAGLTDLKTRAEVAVKSGALVLVLGGDCAQTIGLLTAARRYYKHLNLLWMDRDADLNNPATTPSGRIDGMVVACIIGKGAPELVRFWGEPQLVREPEVYLFGIERLDPPEQEFLSKSPMRHLLAVDVQRKSPAAAAKTALSHLHADAREYCVHLDTELISSAEFPAVNVPAEGGLPLADVRAALTEAARSNFLVGLTVTQYNPDKDPDGSSAKKLVDLLVESLSVRLEAAPAPAAPEPTPAPEPATPEPTSEPTPASDESSTTSDSE
jgi:arginase